jgi:hypothetical protein
MSLYFEYVTLPCGHTYGYDKINGKEPWESCRYPACTPKVVSIATRDRVGRNAQIGEKERPIIWENPRVADPKERYFYPGVKKEMPERLKKDGFQVKEFTNFQEHVKFQKEHNLINKKTNE